MLTLEGFSETGLLRHLSNHVFRSPYIRKYISHERHLFLKIVQKFDVDFRNVEEISEKIFSFLDNYVRIGFCKFF